MPRLVLHPRRRRTGYRYDVEHDGTLIVVVSDDPEHFAARALLDLGLKGRAEIIDANTGVPRLRFVERNRSGLNTEPWCPLPSEISHGVPRARDSDAAEGS